MANIDEPTGDALLVIRNMAKTKGASPFESLNKDGGKEPGRLSNLEHRRLEGRLRHKLTHQIQGSRLS